MTDNDLYSLLSSLVSTYSVSGNEKDIVDFLDKELTFLGYFYILFILVNFIFYVIMLIEK